MKIKGDSRQASNLPTRTNNQLDDIVINETYVKISLSHLTLGNQLDQIAHAC